jgi:hypothetical protein
MERALGRPIRSDEVVHHIDGNGLNNSIGNLTILSQSGHARGHRTGCGRIDIDRAVALRLSGSTYAEIGRTFGVNWVSVRQALVSVRGINISHRRIHARDSLGRFSVGPSVAA